MTKLIILLALLFSMNASAQLPTSSSTMSFVHDKNGYNQSKVNIQDTTLTLEDLELNIVKTIPYPFEGGEAYILLLDNPVIDVATAYYKNGNLVKLKVERRDSDKYVELVATTKQL